MENATTQMQTGPAEEIKNLLAELRSTSGNIPAPRGRVNLEKRPGDDDMRHFARRYWLPML
ncbi:hypothetical protein LTR53_011916, partial [Teratosphaeriaceae sp. CCFEE 6253]